MDERTETSGEQFLHKKFSELYTSQPVEYEQERRGLYGEKVHTQPEDKLHDWMEVLEQTHTSHEGDPVVMERIKNYYHNKYVVREENIHQSYWNSQGEKMVSEGRMGDLEHIGVGIKEKYDEEGKRIGRDFIFPERLKKHEIAVKQKEQERSLDRWIDYLTGPDSTAIPMWTKYWAFMGMLKLSTYDKEKQVFANRNNSTMALFPELNEEALGVVTDLVEKEVAKKEKGEGRNDALGGLLRGANFGKLYAYVLENISQPLEKDLRITEGQWVEFPKGSDPKNHIPEGFNKSLVDSLQGHGTGWCTAGEEVAKRQLEMGNFYVYYSNNRNGEASEPRVAIRMMGDEIGEIRGIDTDQNLDSYISDVVCDKLDEFGDKGEKYKKTSSDMRLLTNIDKKIKERESLSREELLFLYETSEKISGFGHEEDPRISKLLAGRNSQEDLEIMFNLDPIYLEMKWDQLRERRGLSIKNIQLGHGLKFPEHFRWDLQFTDLISGEGLVLPTEIEGNLSFYKLSSLVDMPIPKIIGGSLEIPLVENIENISLPTLNGLWAEQLPSLEGISFSKNINGGIRIKNANIGGVVLPETVSDNLLLDVPSFENVKLPKAVGGDLYLSSTEAPILSYNPSIEGLVKDYFARRNHFDRLENISLPDQVDGDVSVKFKDLRNISFPKIVGGVLHCEDVESAVNVSLPSLIGGSCHIYNLKNIDNVVFPSKIGEGSRLPEGVVIHEEDANTDNF